VRGPLPSRLQVCYKLFLVNAAKLEALTSVEPTLKEMYDEGVIIDKPFEVRPRRPADSPQTVPAQSAQVHAHAGAHRGACRCAWTWPSQCYRQTMGNCGRAAATNPQQVLKR
jgi:hypothetical protein